MMHLGLNTSGTIPAADWPLIEDLGVTYLKVSYDLETHRPDILLATAEDHAAHGCRTIVDLRDTPALRQQAYQRWQGIHAREWMAVNAYRAGWSEEEVEQRWVGLGRHAAFRQLTEAIEEREGEDGLQLERVLERINRPSFLAQAEEMAEEVAQVVTCVGHLAKHWEVWGEWNCPWTSQGTFSAWDYTIHLAAAYQGIKGTDPEAKVLNGGGGIEGSLEWLEFLLSPQSAQGVWFPQGAGHLFDFCNWHHYGHTAMPEVTTAGEFWTLETQIAAYHNLFGRARRLLDEHGHRQRNASTEWGVPMIAGLKPRKLASNVYEGGVWAIPEEVSGDWYAACLDCFAEEDFEILCVHELRERDAGGRDRNWWGAFCGLVDIDGKQRPAWNAVQERAWAARAGNR